MFINADKFHGSVLLQLARYKMDDMQYIPNHASDFK